MGNISGAERQNPQSQEVHRMDLCIPSICAHTHTSTHPNTPRLPCRIPCTLTTHTHEDCVYSHMNTHVHIKPHTRTHRCAHTRPLCTHVRTHAHTMHRHTLAHTCTDPPSHVDRCTHLHGCTPQGPVGGSHPGAPLGSESCQPASSRGSHRSPDPGTRQWWHFVVGVLRAHSGRLLPLPRERLLPHPAWPGSEDINLPFRTAGLRNHFPPTPRRAVKDGEVLESRDSAGVSVGVGGRGEGGTKEGGKMVI